MNKKLLIGIGAILLACVCLVVVAGGGLLAYSVIQVQNLPSVYDEEALAQQAIAQALAQAELENKYVLLDFGADWCPDCQALARMFEKDEIKPFLDEHFIVVYINVGSWDKNLDIAEKYGNPIAQGIPAVVIVDANNRIITTTENGALATASTASPQEILDFLREWAP